VTVFGSSKPATGRFRANRIKLANDNNNPALADFPSVMRAFMQRYYYFFAYLLCLIVALSTHDAHTAPEDTTPETFGFTGHTGVKAPASDSISGVDEIDYRIAGLKPSY
jgi:hypothetical protein